ncbi:MAG TPA: PQQ-binding-like beta-propeller repeat protein [Bryobacteraceae bacterium]|jgi:polyvinyl alcohol dehydrogenase (cytochrome)
MKRLILFLGIAALCRQQAAAQDGAALYKQMCATCHEGGADRAPTREALRSMSAERVLAALESGAMISVAVRRTTAERRAIAEFVTGKTFTGKLQTQPSAEAMCPPRKPPAPLTAPRVTSVPTGWKGWGQDHNSRFQTRPGFTAAEVPRLKLKWAFAFPGDIISNAQATTFGDQVFVGSSSGMVYSLDANTGCVNWYFQADSWVRAAISTNGSAAYFGDGVANVYAVNAKTGKLLWKVKADNYPVARVTGSPTLVPGILYVPIASGEEGAGAAPDYECCRFRGALVALRTSDGKQLWKTYTIDVPKPTKKNKSGTQLWGPSGAPIWSSPTIDEKLNVVYVTTGDNYSDPATRSSDAFMAFDQYTGKILWSRQMTPNDSYNVGCRMPDATNCPDSDGPDLDFSSSPILVNLPKGKRALIAGQKSGVVHALDPDNQGEVLWQTRIGKGGSLGGIQWGSAADYDNVYVALADVGRIRLTYSQSTDADPKAGGGMFALRLTDGKQVWYTPPGVCGDRPRCSPAQSAAVSAMPGVAFSGSVDGHIRAYAMTDGKIIWDFDTIREYKTVNGVAGHGGSLDGPGPAIGGGMLFLNSGYPTGGGTPGNVLLAFSVDGK